MAAETYTVPHDTVLEWAETWARQILETHWSESIRAAIEAIECARVGDAEGLAERVADVVRRSAAIVKARELAEDLRDERIGESLARWADDGGQTWRMN